MSSIEEINRKIEQVTNEIGEVQTAIKTWENDIATKTNNNAFWTKRFEQLGDEKNNLQTEKNELQAQKTILLRERERQSALMSLKELLQVELNEQISNSQAEQTQIENNSTDSGVCSNGSKADSKTTNGSKKDKRSAKASGTNTPASQHDNLACDNIFSWPTMQIDNVEFETLNEELLKHFLDKLDILDKETYIYKAYIKNEDEGNIVCVEDDVRFKIICTLNEIFSYRILKDSQKEFKNGIRDQHGYTGDIRWVDKNTPYAVGDFIIEAKARHAFGFTSSYSPDYVQILFDKAKKDAYLSRLKNPVKPADKKEDSEIDKIKFIDKDTDSMLSILKQTWSYMKSLNEQLMKKGKDPIFFCMISTYQMSLLIKWDGPTMYVSHWFPTQRLLPLTYLLYLLRYDEYVPDMLKEFVTQIRLSFPQENQTTWKPPIPYNIRKGGDGGSNNNNRRDDGDGDDANKDETPAKRHKSDVKHSNTTNNGEKTAGNQFPTISAKQMSDIWYSHSDPIAYSDNVVISKSRPSYPLPQPIVLKVLNQYHCYREEQDELNNEMKIYGYFKKRAEQGLSYMDQVVPKLIFLGRVDIYIILAIEFIDGVCYSSFKEMSKAEKEACRESVNELHKARVLHGDLHSRNFIIVKNKRHFNAYIIDFGRSTILERWQRKELIKEMIELNQNLFQSPNTSSDLDVSY